MTSDRDRPADFDPAHLTPEHARAAAAIAAEQIRWLNHATIGPRPSALHSPADVDVILTELGALGQRLPQLLDQLGAYTSAECREGRVRVDALGASSLATEAQAVAVLLRHLGTATTGAREFESGVNKARQITAKLTGAPEPRPTLREAEPRFPWPWANEFPEPQEGD